VLQMKVLIMEIWGDLGQFRKFYTTSSPLTFSIPPPTAVAGTMGAIVGLSRENYIDTFNADTFDVAVSLVNPVAKTRMTLNHIETKSARMMSRIKMRTQILSEFLKDAHFRFYLYFKDEQVFENLKSMLKSHQTTYTLSLGLSELIASFKYGGEYDAEKINGNGAEKVSSVVLTDSIEEGSIDFEEGARFQKERIPVRMKPDRSVDLYRTVLLNADAGPLKIKAKNLWRISNGKTVMFLGPLLSPKSR
jgi:CRISPR-associated protein Cas5h